jgi:hypothetical protein
MKSINDQLERLLRAAARAPGVAPDTVPFATEQAALAAWRHGLADDDDAEAMLALFRRVLAGAFVVALLALGASYQELLSNEADIEMATAAVQANLDP